MLCRKRSVFPSSEMKLKGIILHVDQTRDTSCKFTPLIFDYSM